MARHKQVEERLRGAEELLEKVFSAIHTLIAYMDSDFTIIRVNRAYAEAFGRDAESFVGQNHFALFPDPTSEAIFREVVASGRPHHAYERPLLPEGDASEPPRYWDWSLHPVREADGEITGLVLSMVDVSERKRAEEALRVSERKREIILSERKRIEHERLQLAAAIEKAVDCVVIMDPEGNVRYVNPAFETTTGYTRDEIVGQNLRLLESEADNDSARGRWAALGRGLVWKGRLTNRRKDGTRYEVESSITPIFDLEDPTEIAEYVAVEHDVTREVELEQRLRQAHKMEALGTLAGGIAHDLNNVLMPIIMNAELLLEDVEQQEAQMRLVEKILASATRGRDLVRQVVTFSRRSEERHRPLRIAPVVKEALELLRASLPTNIEIRKRVTAPSCAVRSDPTQIHQVVLNLCNNAAHAMRESGGVLEVALHEVALSEEEASRFPNLRPGRYASVEVGDSGTGIDPAVMDRMFEPFYTTKKPGEGTGMGLAVVHGIVSRHQGTIEVASAPERGSRFSVLLPAVENEDRDDEKPSRPPGKGRGTILLVDDEAPIVESVEPILARLGYDVIASTDPEEALRVYRERPDRIDLLLVDHMMPGMTGLALTAEIRGENHRVPVILYTGHSGSLDQGEARDLGVSEILTKPLTRDELGESIGRALEGAR